MGSTSQLGLTDPGAAALLRLARAEAFEQTVADLRDETEKLAGERGLAVTFVATRGDSLAELHRIARESRADAIVVGASAKAGHRIAGSLAVRLVRSGQWPVTVVP